MSLEDLREVVHFVTGREPDPTLPGQLHPVMAEDLAGLFRDPIDPRQVGDVVDVGHRFREGGRVHFDGEEERPGVGNVRWQWRACGCGEDSFGGTDHDSAGSSCSSDFR